MSVTLGNKWFGRGHVRNFLLAFAVDCCDREASCSPPRARSAARTFVLWCSLCGRASVRAVNCPPIGVDWLSDDSNCYVAGAILARDVGRDPRTNLNRKPTDQTNGRSLRPQDQTYRSCERSAISGQMKISFCVR